MKAPKEKRSAQLHILISEQEMDKIRERMAQTGITNTSAFIRKMAIDGYVINLDLSEVRELTRLLRICSNNLNQYARKAHETGSIYAVDIADLQSRMDGLWKIAKKLLTEFTNILLDGELRETQTTDYFSKHRRSDCAVRELTAR